MEWRTKIPKVNALCSTESTSAVAVRWVNCALSNKSWKQTLFLSFWLKFTIRKNLSIHLNTIGITLPREKINQWKKSPNTASVIFAENTIKMIRENLLPAKSSHWDNPDFKFIDLFAGIGGLRKGFEEVGGKCIFTSEWEQKARRTYLANHYVDECELPYFLDSAEENPE